MNGVTRIIDAHHHLWNLEVGHRYPWLMEQGVRRFFGDPAPIQKNYLVDDLRADFAELPVTGSVHIQVGVAAGDEVAETLWLEEQRNCCGLPTAIIAYCDLAANDVENVLEAHQQAGGLRGIRQIIGRSAEEDARTGSADLIENPAFLSGLKVLESRGLSFDLQLVPGQMIRMAELLERVPGLPIALCHAGSLSDFSEAGRETWLTGMRRLAQLEHVICKVSGFGMFDSGWSAESVRRQFLSVVDIFGTDRIAFGSNFPVERLCNPYGAVWRRFDVLAAELGEREREAVFAGTAERFYRLC